MQSSATTSVTDSTFVASDLLTISNSDDTLSIYSLSRSHIGEFYVTITSTMVDEDGEPYSYATSLIPIEYQFQLTVIDPCIDSVLQPTISSLEFNYILG
jgi:hypothetical protein